MPRTGEETSIQCQNASFRVYVYTQLRTESSPRLFRVRGCAENGKGSVRGSPCKGNKDRRKCLTRAHASHLLIGHSRDFALRLLTSRAQSLCSHTVAIMCFFFFLRCYRRRYSNAAIRFLVKRSKINHKMDILRSFHHNSTVECCNNRDDYG